MNKMEEIQQIAKTMQTEKALAFAEGVRYALADLSEVYGEGIEETDLWAQYREEEGEQ